MGLEATTQAPADELDPNDDATPEADEADEEQGDAEEIEDRPDTSAAAPTDPRLAQAEFTRSQQAFADLKKQLGLPKTASREEVAAAVTALQNAPATHDESDDELLAPEIAERLTAAEQRAFDAELRVASAIYGQDFTTDAVDVIDTLRTTNDPTQLMSALHGLILKYGAAEAGAGGAETTQDDETTTDQPLDIGTSEGDRGGSVQTTTAQSRGRESGVVSAVRGIFKAASDAREA